eukprot:gene35434-40080_t
MRPTPLYLLLNLSRKYHEIDRNQSRCSRSPAGHLRCRPGSKHGLLRSAAGSYPADKAPWLSMAQMKFDRASYGEAILHAQEALQRDPGASGNSSITAVNTQTPKVIGLDHRISSAPLEIDSARRRFCSIRPPRIKPSNTGDSGSTIQSATSRASTPTGNPDSGSPADESAITPNCARRALTRRARARSGVTSAAVRPGVSSVSRSSRAQTS